MRVLEEKRMRADPTSGPNNVAGAIGPCASAQAWANAIQQIADLRAEREDGDDGQQRDAGQDESVLCEPLPRFSRPRLDVRSYARG
jgi:hypothetical protein